MINYNIVLKSLLETSQRDGFSGYDPFDGLNSKLFELVPTLNKSILGLVWIQLFKRIPFNFRRITGVPKKRNPKGIGLFILGLLNDYQLTHESQCLEQAIVLADWLLTQQSDKSEWLHSCWGYHFDWKARAFYVPKGKPNVITTVYVSLALYNLAKVLEAEGELDQADRYLKPALDSASFIVRFLYTKTEGREFFAYIPGETAFVHNASLWASAWVAVVARKTKNTRYMDLALKVARQSVAEQGKNGSWVYGGRGHHQFIDGFHTGYNLEALNLLRQSADTKEFDSAIEKGFKFYKENLFEPDGTSKYYHNSRYPLDPHSVSQAIITYVQLAKSQEDYSFIRKIINKAIEELYLPEKGQFVYQKTARITNKINYMRWTQAWMYYSLSYYLNNVGEFDE